MDRASNKHSPRLDDQMEREVRSHLQGSPATGRIEEWREPEPSGEDEPDVSAVLFPDRVPAGDTAHPMTALERERRSRFGKYVPRSTFPADREDVVKAARTARAPDDILDELRQLPPDRSFQNVAQVWAALGYPMDERF